MATDRYIDGWTNTELTCPSCHGKFFPKYNRPGQVDKNRAYPQCCSIVCRDRRLSRIKSETNALRRIGYHRYYLRKRYREAQQRVIKDRKFFRSHCCLIRRLTLICPICSKRFIRRMRGKSSTHPGLYCSNVCWTQAKREFERRRRERRLQHRNRKKVDRAKSPFDPVEIFDRDDWTCYICGDRLDPELRGSNDPKAPEIDHIRSLADGGEHVRRNVACSCRECNRRKGANSYGYHPE